MTSKTELTNSLDGSDGPIILGGGGAGGDEYGRTKCCLRHTHSLFCKNFRPWWIIRAWLTTWRTRNV